MRRSPGLARGFSIRSVHAVITLQTELEPGLSQYLLTVAAVNGAPSLPLSSSSVRMRLKVQISASETKPSGASSTADSRNASRGRLLSEK